MLLELTAKCLNTCYDNGTLSHPEQVVRIVAAECALNSKLVFFEIMDSVHAALRMVDDRRVEGGKPVLPAEHWK